MDENVRNRRRRQSDAAAALLKQKAKQSKKQRRQTIGGNVKGNTPRTTPASTPNSTPQPSPVRPKQQQQATPASSSKHHRVLLGAASGYYFKQPRQHALDASLNNDTSFVSMASSSSEDSQDQDQLNVSVLSDTTELTASNFVRASTSRKVLLEIETPEPAKQTVPTKAPAEASSTALLDKFSQLQQSMPPRTSSKRWSLQPPPVPTSKPPQRHSLGGNADRLLQVTQTLKQARLQRQRRHSRSSIDGERCSRLSMESTESRRLSVGSTPGETTRVESENRRLSVPGLAEVEVKSAASKDRRLSVQSLESDHKPNHRLSMESTSSRRLSIQSLGITEVETPSTIQDHVELLGQASQEESKEKESIPIIQKPNESDDEEVKENVSTAPVAENLDLKEHSEMEAEVGATPASRTTRTTAGQLEVSPASMMTTPDGLGQAVNTASLAADPPTAIEFTLQHAAQRTTTPTKLQGSPGRLPLRQTRHTPKVQAVSLFSPTRQRVSLGSVNESTEANQTADSSTMDLSALDKSTTVSTASGVDKSTNVSTMSSVNTSGEASEVINIQALLDDSPPKLRRNYNNTEENMDTQVLEAAMQDVMDEEEEDTEEAHSQGHATGTEPSIQSPKTVSQAVDSPARNTRGSKRKSMEEENTVDESAVDKSVLMEKASLQSPPPKQVSEAVDSPSSNTRGSKRKITDVDKTAVEEALVEESSQVASLKSPPPKKVSEAVDSTASNTRGSKRKSTVSPKKSPAKSPLKSVDSPARNTRSNKKSRRMSLGSALNPSVKETTARSARRQTIATVLKPADSPARNTRNSKRMSIGGDVDTLNQNEEVERRESIGVSSNLSRRISTSSTLSIDVGADEKTEEVTAPVDRRQSTASTTSILNSAMRPKGSARKNQHVEFGSPEFREFNKGSPSMNLTPMPKNRERLLEDDTAEIEKDMHDLIKGIPPPEMNPMVSTIDEEDPKTVELEYNLQQLLFDTVDSPDAVKESSVPEPQQTVELEDDLKEMLDHLNSSDEENSPPEGEDQTMELEANLQALLNGADDDMNAMSMSVAQSVSRRKRRSSISSRRFSLLPNSRINLSDEGEVMMDDTLTMDLSMASVDVAVGVKEGESVLADKMETVSTTAVDSKDEEPVPPPELTMTKGDMVKLHEANLRFNDSEDFLKKILDSLEDLQYTEFTNEMLMAVTSQVENTTEAVVDLQSKFNPADDGARDKLIQLQQDLAGENKEAVEKQTADLMCKVKGVEQSRWLEWQISVAENVRDPLEELQAEFEEGIKLLEEKESWILDTQEILTGMADRAARRSRRNTFEERKVSCVFWCLLYTHTSAARNRCLERGDCSDGIRVGCIEGESCQAGWRGEAGPGTQGCYWVSSWEDECRWTTQGYCQV